MSEIPQWLNTIILAIPSFCTGAATVLYTRWRYIRDRQFSTVSDEKRFRTFKKIEEIEKSKDSSHKECMLKTLYESIGMFFPSRYNYYLLKYANEMGLPYKHSNLNHFLKSSNLMDINIRLNQFELNKKRYFWHLAFWWAVSISVTISLPPLSYAMLKIAPSLKEGKDILSYIFSGSLGGVWAFLYIYCFRSTQNCIGAQKFYNEFSPWLKKRNTDEKNENTQASARLTVQEIKPSKNERKLISAIKRLIVRLKWKI